MPNYSAIKLDKIVKIGIDKETNELIIVCQSHNENWKPVDPDEGDKKQMDRIKLDLTFLIRANDRLGSS